MYDTAAVADVEVRRTEIGMCDRLGLGRREDPREVVDLSEHLALCERLSWSTTETATKAR